MTGTHFVGIGGAGMSGIAKIFLEKGYAVSGSDLAESDLTKTLEGMGARITYGHSEDAVDGSAGMLVVSTAIPPCNPEVKKARRLGIPVKQRGSVLAELMDEKKGIAVAGAHGKTTTTSMIALILENCGLDPAFLIGAKLENLGTNGRWGAGEYMVAEADESDGSFLFLNPWTTVVTNVEDDHLDFYGSKERLQKAFREFVLKTPATGKAVLCTDCQILNGLIPEFERQVDVCTYGIHHKAMLTARNLTLHTGGSRSEIWLRDRLLGTLELKAPGEHNVSDALAALAAGFACGLDFESMAEVLAGFTGAKRRFELVGEKGGIRIYDDYAHHPTELRATIQAAKTLRAKRLVVVFQPHRYTRTKHFAEAFADALREAELLVMTSVYPAGEAPIPGVNAELILKYVQPEENREVLFEPDLDLIPELLAPRLKQGDLVVVLGAGNVCRVGRKLYETL
ncbi:MAG: UDP-N-acetylmuramate--L-alanine ligase [Peptococcaceae bacterium]|jgi:UDP-N-acetylmuramate--alanine ligase|nr:UDP-N-acetylmuramate--L-alanine ligase [Peptococcaceae bacterium]